MLDLIKLRKQHGYQAIPDPKNAVLIKTHRGFPIIVETLPSDDWQKTVEACPTGAILNQPRAIDLGKCIFCGECERISNSTIRFSSDNKIASTNREHLIIHSGTVYEKYRSSAIEAKKEIHKLFGRSLKLRQVSAGGCNGCEMELAACGNVNFDMGRYGIDFVASPRHADGIVITGPVTKNMAPALKDAFNSISDPKIVIAVGACAISGGIFSNSTELNRDFLENMRIDLYIPGCPPHPLVIINGILDFLGKNKRFIYSYYKLPANLLKGIDFF
jgi:Ni,Fe-hydrogenase III small subunit